MSEITAVKVIPKAAIVRCLACRVLYVGEHTRETCLYYLANPDKLKAQ